jgi:hypothetical protein
MEFAPRANWSSPSRRHFDNLARHSSHGTREGGYDLWGVMATILRGRILFALGVAALLGGAAHAENLDAGKSGARLFADSCTTCHRSAKGLTKGRFRLTLYFFLQQHYASNSSSAWELASYLESVDEGARPKPRGAAPKRSPPAAAKLGSSFRPPAPVPQR